MPVDLSLVHLGWIESGQLGYPLAHRRAGFFHCVSVDRVTNGPLSGSVHAGKVEDVAQFCFRVGDSFEQRLLAMLGTEVIPLFRGGTFAAASESCGGLTCCLERRLEM